MDRRRFVPTLDGLEGRALLSTFVRTSVGLVNTEVPLSTLQQRMQRIDRLPNFLASINPKANVPAGPSVAALQQNLVTLLGTMHAASRNGIVAYNAQLRDLVSRQSVAQDKAAQLNDTFGKILISAGAAAPVVTSLQTAMNDLARVTIASTASPSSFVANEYALVLELALAIGKPLPAPGKPSLNPTDDSPPKNDHRTTNNQPSLVGRYEPNTTVQIVDQSGSVVLGSAPTNPKGKYTVPFALPLTTGAHTVRIRAIGPQGALSLLSQPYKLVIVPVKTK